MKTILVSFFILILTLNYSVGQEFNILEKSKKLKDYYIKALNQKEYKIKFFLEFPENFDCFNKIYGNGPKPYDFKAGPLYNEAFKHIVLFSKLSAFVEDSVYITKVVNISIDGHWDADAISYFQNEVLEIVVSQKLSILCAILNNYNEKEIESFWKFYFDGSHPVKTIPNNLEKIKNINSRIYDIIVKAHKSIIDNSDNHGQ